MIEDGDILPAGVKLRAFEDSDSLRSDIFNGVKDTLTSSFPKEYGGVKIELKDVDYEDVDRVPLSDQKKAILNSKYLYKRLKGTLTLKDSNTGEVLDEIQNHTLMRVPYLTDRSTFIHNGSEYSVLNQSRLESGVYSRRKTNGDIEAHINPERGAGRAMRVRLEPETGLFKLDIGQSSLSLYSLMKDIGVSDDQLEATWGKDLLDRNKAKYDSRVLGKAYNMLTRGGVNPEADVSEKVQSVLNAIKGTRIKKETLGHTLNNLVS
jgi:DNA-directed RNA polymerase beta subunit